MNQVLSVVKGALLYIRQRKMLWLLPPAVALLILGFYVYLGMQDDRTAAALHYSCCAPHHTERFTAR